MGFTGMKMPVQFTKYQATTNSNDSWDHRINGCTL